MKKIMIVGVVATIMLTMSTMAATIQWKTGNLSGTAVNSGTFNTEWVGQTMTMYLVASDFDFAGFKADLAAGNNVSGYALTVDGSAAIASGNKGQNIFGADTHAPLDSLYGFGMAYNANANLVVPGTVDILINNTLWSGSVAANGADPTAVLGSWATINVVPEPTSMALLALGIAALGLRRKLS